ncbi:MAG: exodeoxyribonuclease VII small subunit [Anaerolineales bacterium]|nr:exodeoxyribonuclease VII small subunit [Chloroflexota bacterium]MBL6981553.1 exodeoxyribonuclease VII small subunit [Anaerolineales bacterium]
MSKKKPSVEELNYEDAFTELEGIINMLETDEQTLDEILAIFERGQALAKYCADLLDKAELKTKQLSGDEITDFEISE